MKVFGIDLCVVMIFYFIGIFGFGVDVEKVKEVICIVKEKCLDLIIDGLL